MKKTCKRTPACKTHRDPNGQTERIKRLLRSGATLTPYSALHQFGTLRLSERIREAEADGMTIKREWLKVEGARVMSYRMQRK